MQPLRQTMRHLTELKIFPDTEIALQNQEQIEFMNELIESLKQELTYKTEQLQEIEEELRDTNDELSNALIPSESLTLTEAKELAKTILETQKPAKECLAELLSAIYDSPVESRDLDPQGRSPNEINALKSSEFNSVSCQNSRFLEECHKLKIQFMGNKELVYKMAIQCDNLKKNIRMSAALRR